MFVAVLSSDGLAATRTGSFVGLHQILRRWIRRTEEVSTSSVSSSASRRVLSLAGRGLREYTFIAAGAGAIVNMKTFGSSSSHFGVLSGWPVRSGHVALRSQGLRCLCAQWLRGCLGFAVDCRSLACRRDPSRTFKCRSSAPRRFR